VSGSKEVEVEVEDHGELGRRRGGSAKGNARIAELEKVEGITQGSGRGRSAYVKARCFWAVGIIGILQIGHHNEA